MTSTKTSKASTAASKASTVASLSNKSDVTLFNALVSRAESLVSFAKISTSAAYDAHKTCDEIDKVVDMFRTTLTTEQADYIRGIIESARGQYAWVSKFPNACFAYSYSDILARIDILQKGIDYCMTLEDDFEAQFELFPIEYNMDMLRSHLPEEYEVNAKKYKHVWELFNRLEEAYDEAFEHAGSNTQEWEDWSEDEE